MQTPVTQPDPSDDTATPTALPADFSPAAIDRARQMLDAVPDRIGRYRILERLGGGGMGEVYVAEQTEPIKRRVAVKVIKAGMDTRQVVARFEAERQALAMMDHPNIARVFDAGATETGRPYFVMELVRGIPITRFADENKLTTRQRVELLVPICQAVQHAHQKGIIHRDIKPHNVLVTLHDGKPVPKVIDFGIAKATSQPLTDKTVYTEFRQMIGTPAYMSPEQAEMSGLDIDTRSDIYSLGVLAYELLTGIPPFDNERLVKAGLGEIQRIIREEDPPRPSIRFSTIGDRLTTIAKSRDVEPSKLSKLLAGELDWIVMRAIEKDRRRRYDTATDLAADLKRHLDGEPVVAAPPTWAYRTRKFVRKNKGLLAAAAAIGAVMALGLGGTSWEAIRALQERKKTDFVNSQLLRERNRAASTLKRINTATYGEDAMDLDPIAKMVQKATGREVSSVDLLAADAEAINGQLQQRTEAAELEAYTADLALAQSAMASGNWPEARARLDACPESKRGWEWTFLRKQSAVTLRSFGSANDFDLSRTGDAIRLHGDPWKDTITGASFKSKLDTTWDLDASETGVRLLNPMTGKVEATLTGKFYSNSEVGPYLSPDNRWIVTAEDQASAGAGPHPNQGCSIEIWDTRTTKSVCRLPLAFYFNGNRARISFSEDGRRICVISDPVPGKDRPYTVSIWNTVEGKSVCPPIQFYNWVVSAEFSPDGSRILTDSDNTAQIWNCATGKPTGVPMRHEAMSIADSEYTANIEPQFSSDGTRVLVPSDLSVQIWNAATGAIEGNYDSDLQITGAGFTPTGNGLIVTACLWGNPMRDNYGESYGVHETPGAMDGSVPNSYMQECTLVSINGGINGRLSFYDPRSMWYLPAAAMSRDEKLLFLACGGRVSSVAVDNADSAIDRFISPETAQLEVLAATDQTSWPTIAVTPTKSAVFGVSLIDGIVKVSSAAQPDVFHVGSPDAPVKAITFSNDKSRIVTGDESTVRLYDTVTWREVAEFHEDLSISNLGFTPDGTRLIVQFADGSAQIWDARPLAERRKMWARRAAERTPAREYVAKLLASTATTQPADLKKLIREDSSITPLRKLVALEQLDIELRKRQRESIPQRSTTQPPTTRQ